MRVHERTRRNRDMAHTEELLRALDAELLASTHSGSMTEGVDLLYQLLERVIRPEAEGWADMTEPSSISIRSAIISEIERLAEAEDKQLPQLTEDLVLLELAGLDSLAIAILVARLRRSSG